MTTVLLTAPYMIPYQKRFLPIFKHYGLEMIVPEVHERMSESELLVYAGLYDAGVCGDDQYTEKVYSAAAPRLKILSKWGTGIDSLNQGIGERYGVRILNTPNAFTLPVADSVLGYMLDFVRRLHWMDRFVKEGNWEKLPGKSLSECTLGVIGVGNCGKGVLRRARAFGMKLLGADIIPVAPDFILENSVEMTDLRDLLQRSDFVSLNCTLNPTSFHMMNLETLALMKKNAILINTARGHLVDESALLTALQNGWIGGAALDVFEVEPVPSGSPLLKMDNVMLAPHNANSSPAAWERVHWNTIHNLLIALGIPHDDLKEFSR
jgi:D-3-phosphoglycerate dehydrogenase / 2-oxoglutarate reductase